MPVKKCAACIDTAVCGMFVFRELTSIVIIVDSGVIRWLMSLSFLRKSSVLVIRQGVLCSGGWRMESSYS